MGPLTTPEKQFLALAIQGLCMRQGQSLFPMAAQLAEKLGLLEELKGSLEDWLAYAAPRCARCGAVLHSPDIAISTGGPLVCSSCV